jgi:Region of unknown function (DUF2417)
MTNSLAILFLLLTLTWFVALFVSLFVTIHGFSSRGSGFTPLGYTFLSLLSLLLSLSFFSTPLPRKVRSLALSLSFLLFVNAVIILAVSPLRHYEGWVGVVSVLWAAVTTGVWTLVTNKVVEWAKAEEEERLIGRVEDRYTGTEWMKVMIVLTGIVILLVLETFITLTLLLRARDATLQPLGEKYWVDGKYQVHLVCVGNLTSSSPLIFLEANGDTTAEIFSEWVDEAREENLLTQYCYWDRPGYPLKKSPLSQLRLLR